MVKVTIEAATLPTMEITTFAIKLSPVIMQIISEA